MNKKELLNNLKDITGVYDITPSFCEYCNQSRVEIKMRYENKNGKEESTNLCNKCFYEIKHKLEGGK